MRRLSFDPNRLLVEKAEERKVDLPVTKELNEQELATVDGGWGGDGCGGGWDWGGGGCCGGGWYYHRHFHHHFHHDW